MRVTHSFSRNNGIFLKPYKLHFIVMTGFTYILYLLNTAWADRCPYHSLMPGTRYGKLDSPVWALALSSESPLR